MGCQPVVDERSPFVTEGEGRGTTVVLVTVVLTVGEAAEVVL